jgi:hypothetical protein
MRKAILAVASVVALTACGTTGPTRLGTGNVVFVYVTVKKDGTLAAYPEWVAVRNKNTEIVWRLAADPKYTFTDEAIVIEDDPLGEFDNCKTGKPGKKEDDGYSFVCKDNNHKQGDKQPRIYKYTIKVNGVRDPLDPWVFND